MNKNADGGECLLVRYKENHRNMYLSVTLYSSTTDHLFLLLCKSIFIRHKIQLPRIWSHKRGYRYSTYILTQTQVIWCTNVFSVLLVVEEQRGRTG